MRNQAPTHGNVHLWEELDRNRLKELAHNAMVIVPLGAIEQHGPHLPTGTDIILATAAVERAVRHAAERSNQPFIVAPFLRIGASDHHLPFGGTISLRPSTMYEVLIDAINSMNHSGVRRVILVNGHGGNSGVCHAAASAASTTANVSIAVLDYWNFATEGFGETPIPGHAGRWESSLMLATRPELVMTREKRCLPPNARSPGLGISSEQIWLSIEGYTDEPALGSDQEGAQTWQQIETRLATRFIELSQAM